MEHSTYDIRKTLRALRRRIEWQAIVARTARGWLASAGVLVAVAATRWEAALTAERVAVAAGAGLALCSAWVWARRQSLATVAAQIDRLGQTRDRLQTALALSSEMPRRDGQPNAPVPPMTVLALRECSDWASGRDFRALLPWRVPREAVWLAVPLTALALLGWEVRTAAQAREAEAAAAQESVAGTVGELHALARALEKADGPAQTEELQRIAEALRRSAERVQAEATDRAAAEKAALRELSVLEQSVEEMHRARRDALSPEEREALARALGAQAATQPAADAMQAGDLAEAARHLEQAAKQLTDAGDPAAAAQTERTLREALHRLAAQRELSAGLRQLTQKAQGRGGEGQGTAGEMLRQLAALLSAQPQGPGSQSKAGGKSAAQTLASILAALQQMKHGDAYGKAATPAEGQGGTPGTAVAMQSFATAPNPDVPAPGAADLPTGRPGSERDSGTTASPFGKGTGDLAEKGADLALAGQLGEGESLSQMLPSAGGEDAAARRRYKEIYEAMAPAAQDAVAQENIPLGARFFIQRYFRAIRPEE